jgi:hypothetical protein
METGRKMVKYTGAQLVKQRSKWANICSTMYDEDAFFNIIKIIGWDSWRKRNE